MIMILDLFKYLFAFGSVSCVCIFIGKLIIEKFFDASVERYKTGLTKEIELYKNELERINTEHQIKYNRLHEERARMVKTLHDTLYEVEKNLMNLTSTNQGSGWSNDDTREKDLREKVSELSEILELNRIYFPENLCVKIENVISECYKIIGKMAKAKYAEKNMPKSIEYLEIWTETENYVLNEMKNTRMDIVDEFRNIIGV